MHRKKTNWMKLVADSFSLGVRANQVIALRMATFARGGAKAQAESKMMLDEKVKAAIDANMAAAHSIMIGQPHLAPGRAMTVYRKRVHKNLSRLSKKV